MVTVSDAKEKEKHYVTAAGPTVVEWRPCQKGDSLQGFLTLQLPSGLTLHDCTLPTGPVMNASKGPRWLQSTNISHRSKQRGRKRCRGRDGRQDTERVRTRGTCDPKRRL